MLFLVLLLALTLSPPACPTPAHPLVRRSPIDLKQAKPSQPIITHNHIQTDRKPKAPFIPAQHQLYIPPHSLVLPARSNVRHSSVHTDVHHISNGHVNIPVVTQTVHHSSSNITHPGPVLVHHYEPVLVHDLSVIPLHRATRPGPPGQPRAAARSGFEQPGGYVPFPYFGGYGAGLRYGGHGAGHGFYVAGFR
ncbi:hypothetical protein JYU34_013928 [Plutella xylostella]|uniref:Uncharacterized protein n=1 Tax=Plutella xylostella TaxID=51655 RepID=A0ABQ7QB00_PLUXY|nr:hypothetical protein JYU34_013928 [Plutella xylostella]